MKELNFKVRRRMDNGSEQFAAGDKRKLSAVDAVRLVQSGALEPADKEAADAMEALVGDSPQRLVVPVIDRATANSSPSEDDRPPARPVTPPAPRAPAKAPGAKAAPRNAPAKRKAAAKAGAKAQPAAPLNKADVTTPGADAGEAARVSAAAAGNLVEGGAVDPVVAAAPGAPATKRR